MEATAATLERRVRVIPATRKPEELHRHHDGKMRVAAYCRVSTDSEEQLNSYEAQKTYYTQKIQDSPDWEMAGVYADEGISGTSLKKRTQFNKMITACKRGHIDLIITKSLSRFARNTVDCLDTVRLLKANGIGVYFFNHWAGYTMCHKSPIRLYCRWTSILWEVSSDPSVSVRFLRRA